ncbi:MAG TPA: M4 family metallopeptidase [Myxococcaceae bacterium]|jgi:Zn-dependent metalloprotease
MKIVPAAPRAASQSQGPVAARPPPSSSSPSSSFEPASRRQAPVALAPPVVPEVRTGPLALDSAKAQSAIQQTQAALAPQGLVAGGGSDAWVPLQVNRDAVGGTHVRMQRMFEDTKVFGEQRIGHLDRGGALKDVTGESASIPQGLGGQVKLSPEQAESAARASFGDKAPSEKPSVEKVIFRDDQGNYRAGYHVELADLSGQGLAKRMNYLVDGASGEVAKSWNALGGFDAAELGLQGQQAALPGRPVPMPRPGGQGPSAGTGTPQSTGADDQTMYSGRVDLTTARLPNGQHVLSDTTRGQGIETRDAQNRQTDGGSVLFQDNNGRFGESMDSPRQKGAVDAQYGATMTYDFLKDVLGRNSIDGRGEKLVNNVHLGNNWVNAQWTGQQMDYGDGDGRVSPLTTLDIAGHEIAHGLTQRTAGLVYSGESGGLNEAFSDIMGSGVEWYASQKNPNVKSNWTIGESAFKPGGLRSMSDPAKDGRSADHYSKYRPGMDVHFSSGIANNAFYMLANGGTNRTSGQGVQGGIGMEKGLKIFGQALTNYMTPNTNFSQARAATIRAATDLYGATSTEVQKVKSAWQAVGVR